MCSWFTAAVLSFSWKLSIRSVLSSNMERITKHYAQKYHNWNISNFREDCIDGLCITDFIAVYLVYTYTWTYIVHRFIWLFFFNFGCCYSHHLQVKSKPINLVNFVFRCYYFSLIDLLDLSVLCQMHCYYLLQISAFDCECSFPNVDHAWLGEINWCYPPEHYLHRQWCCWQPGQLCFPSLPSGGKPLAVCSVFIVFFYF